MDFYKFFFLGTYFLFFITFCYTLNIDGQVCFTPLLKIGKCVQIENCPELFNLLHKTPVPREDVNYLRHSHCGYKENSPKVCCHKPISNALPLASPSNKVASPLLPDLKSCGLHMYNIHKGKHDALIGEFPWLALLEYQGPSGRGFHCGGTLINNRYILTAAQCVLLIPNSWKLVNVRLGENKLDKQIDCEPTSGHCADLPIEVPVERAIVHENYDPSDHSQLNDIALLRLERQINFTDFVRPICLPTTSDVLNGIEIGERLHTAGWGLINEQRSQSKTKLKDFVRLRSHEDCSTVYDTIGVSLENQLCIDEKGCATDSGGSLVIEKQTSAGYNWFVVGVKSFGPTPCGNGNWPGVYTNIGDHIRWIVDQLKP